jgi:1-acyl-sn-glycerol-3-phosphate acyltransferase
MKRAFHKIAYYVLRALVGPFIRRALGFHCKRANIPTPALIVSNHVTNYDPILLGLSFRKHMYFVASEHTMRWGMASKLIRVVFAPVIRVKGKTETAAALKIMRRIKKGGTVCMFAEGNRTFSGVTDEIYPATGKLAKMSGCSLVTFKMRGGYFTQPRWGVKVRHGRMDGKVVAVYSPEELAGMTSAEVNARIQADIHEDAYATQLSTPVRYRTKRPAEYIETCLFLCQSCDRIGTVKSQGNRFFCDCGLAGVYDEYGMLSGENVPFTTVRDWYVWQDGRLPGILEASSGVICSSAHERLYIVNPGVGEELIAEGKLNAFCGGLSLDDFTFPFSDMIDFTVTGRQTLTFVTADADAYELKNPYPRNALVYRQIYRAMKNLSKEDIARG